jgi:predicted ribosome quality control (RQC) complex YloA/Tae2 family protein
MDAKLLSYITAELEAEFKGAIVSKIHEPDERTIILKLFSRGRERALLISTRPGLDAMHLTGRKFQNPPAPLRFCALLRNRITNARVESISTAPGERIARIDLLATDDAGARRYALVVELTGKSGNVILLDGEGVVVDALKLFPSGSSARAVEPGVRLEPLPKADMKARPDMTLEKTAGTWNETADALYSTGIDEALEKGHKAELGRVVKKGLTFAQKKRQNLMSDRVKAEADLDKERLGKLLAADFKAMRRGMDEAEVMDFYGDPPCKVRIALDPRLGPAENVERFFKRAKKAKTALKLIAERLPALESEIEYLENVRYELDNAGASDLNAIRDELVEAGYLKKPVQPRRAQARKEIKTEPIRRLKTNDGFSLLVGKSGVGNDLIVKRHAADKDLWFHARGVPGAHVLLKVDGSGREATDEAIEEAARIAAQNSALKTEKKAEVVCAEAKYLKKPAGAKPGMVRVEKYRTLMVRVRDE